MPTSCYYPSCCCCCPAQVKYLTESRAQFILTAWLSVLDVPFPLSPSTYFYCLSLSTFHYLDLLLLHVLWVLSAISYRQMNLSGLIWNDNQLLLFLATLDFLLPAGFSITCNSLWYAYDAVVVEPTQNTIYNCNCRAKVTVQRGVETQRERKIYMNEKLWGKLCAVCTTCRQAEVKQMSKKLQKAYREKREREIDWKGFAISYIQSEIIKSVWKCFRYKVSVSFCILNLP